MHEPVSAPKDPKTRLQEFVQAKGLAVPRYQDVGRSGPDHAPVFEVAVLVDGYPPASAHGHRNAWRSVLPLKPGSRAKECRHDPGSRKPGNTLRLRGPHRRTECWEIHPAQRACWREGLDCLAEGADHRTQVRGIALEGQTQIVSSIPGHLPPEAEAGNRDGHLAWGGAADADVVAVLVDVTRHKDEAQEAVLARLEEIRQPKILFSTRSTSSAATSCWPSRNRSTSAPNSRRPS